MRRCLPRGRSLVWLLLGLAGWMSRPAQTPAQQPPEEVSYRLIHAPWERIFELTEGREEYRKMTREEFFSHVRAVQQALPVPVATGVSVRQATYTARLEGDAFVDGQAQLEIESLQEKLATFPLAAMNLAIETAAWTSPEAKPATLGSTPRGRLVLLVPHSGTLQLSWSRRATQQRPDELFFSFQLPPAPTSRMELTLPSEYVLSSPQGIVRAVPRPGDELADGSTGPPTTLWQVDLGGRPQCELQVRRTNLAMPTAYVHQVDNYRLSEQGVELTAELHLDCPQQPLRQLALRVDPLLRLTKARAGDEAVTWTSSQEDDAAVRSIVLTFSEPIQGRNRIVSISALAPLPETAAWVLPKIEAQQVRWQQQAAWLQLASPLVLRRLQLDQARQIPPREALSTEEVPIGVQYLASTAQIELEIDRQPAEYEVTSGTTVHLGGGGARAEIRAHVRATTRELFALRAEVARGWNISSVEAEDRELVHDWQIRRSPTVGRMLEIRFARPLDPRTPARLRIQARRQLGVGSEPIPLAQLRPLTFSSGVFGPRHFLAVLPEENLLTVFSGDEQMTWLILDDLDNVEAPLVQVQSRDPIIPLDSQYENAFVAVHPLPPDELPYVADVQIIARLTAKELLEQYRLALDGSSAASGPLRVRLSPPRDEEVRWFSEQNPQRTLPARRLTQDGSAPGELWEIDWPESSETTRVILGERTSSSSLPLTVSLLRVQGAQQQEGTVWIEAPGELPLEFRHSPLLIPVPVGRNDYRQLPRSRRAFRFASSAEVLQPDQGLSVALAASSPELGRPPALIWRATLEAYLDPSGVIRSQAWVQLENHGAAELRTQMPPDSRLRRVLINGSETKYTTLESGELSVPLPEQTRFPLLQLVYDRSETTRAWSGSVALTAPAFDAPLLDQQWLVWVAPDYELYDRSANPEPTNFRDCAARVFGPLLRSPSKRPFDLFQQEDWRELGREAVPADALSPFCRQLVTQLGQTTTKRWSDWLSSSASTVGQSETERLWIDANRLAARGIVPSAVPPASTQSTDFERGVDRLRQSRLVLLEAADGVILTSVELIGLWATEVRWFGAECLVAVDQPVIRSSTPEAGPARWLELVPAAAWSDQIPPWREPPSDSVPFAIGGWQLHAIPHVSELRGQLVRRDFGLLAGGVLFLCCLAGSGWISRHHLLLVAALLVGVAVTAILLPAPLGELGPFAWWGTVGGLLFRLTPRRRPASPQEATVIRSPDSRRLPARALLTAGLFVAMTTSPGRAAAAAEAATNGRSPMYDVFLPTDDPEADDLYLPRSFRVRLLEESDRRQGRLAPWVLQAADYRGTFTRRSPTRTALETLTAEYEIIVPELNLPLRLPLAAETVAALEQEARLDGRPVVLQWLAESSVLIVPISQPGPHRLQLTFRPVARTEETGTVLELPIPPAPRARLTLVTPDRSGPVEVATAYGAVQASESTGQIQAELGPARRLVIRWNPPVRSDVPAVEQSSWLRLSPEQVRLDVRFRVDARRWPAESILIEADERLQFDTAGGAQPLSIGPGREDGDRLLQFALLADEADLAMLELNFVLAGASGVGRLRLPRCRVLDQPDVSHWLGVSADPRLVVRNESAREAEPRPAVEFADRWGDGSVPELAFRLQDVVTPWTCSTTLREPTTRAEIQTAYEIFRQATRIIGVANLTTQAGDLFQQQWQVPAGTQWQKVHLVQQGESRALRWVSDRDDSVRVFFDRPVRGSYQLVFVGEQMTSKLGPRTLSRFRLLDVDATTQQLFVFRGNDVTLSPLMSTWPDETTPQLATAVANQLESSGVRRSREHAAILLSDEHPDPVIEVRENEPTMEAELVHVVTRQQNEWYLQLEARLTLEQGILDGLWLEVPEPWVATLQNDSPRIMYGGQSPRPGMARMIVWPAEPWLAGAPVGFSIDRMPIPVSSGAPLTVPNVRLLKQAKMQRYLYLPTEVDSQPVLWDTTGLEPDRVGPEWAPTIAQQPEYRCFRIRDDSFHAVRLPGRSSAGTPRVHLADLHLVWDTVDRYHGLALLDLEPGGVSQCQLRFPEGMSPLRVDVEDTPVVLTSTTDRGTVRLELMSDELPQRISVLYEGGPRADSAAVSPTKWAPTLQTVPTEADAAAQEIEVLQTLWTVCFCDQLLEVVRPASASRNLQESSVNEHERLRLQHLSSTFERAQQMTPDFSRAELGRWYSHWGERFQATFHRARQRARQGNGPDDTLPADLTVQQQAHTASAEKLEVLDAYQRLRSRPDPLDQLSVWQQARGEYSPSRRWTASGWAPAPPVQWQRTTEHPLSRAWLVAALVATIGWGSILVASRGGFGDFRWLHALGVLGGIAWWLWLQPSVFGWLLVGGSLLLLGLQRPPTRSVYD